MSVFPPFSGDVVSQLNALRGMGLGMAAPPAIDAAVREIERLRARESKLRVIEESSEFKQAEKWGYERGYTQAQFDIRNALGIDE